MPFRRIYIPKALNISKKANLGVESQPWILNTHAKCLFRSRLFTVRTAGLRCFIPDVYKALSSRKRVSDFRFERECTA